jgi:transposase-like protein
MTVKNLSADNTNIVSIQLNLFDSTGKDIDFDECLNLKITGSMNLDLENGVVLTRPNHFEFDTRRCPKCGKINLIKKKFIKREVIIDKIGDVILYLKEYFCTKCHKYSKVELKNVLEKYKKTAIQVKDKIIKKAGNGTKSLRKTSKDLKIDDITLSHQTLANIYHIGNTNEISFDIEELSGYVLYDEQFIDIIDKDKSKVKSLPKAQLVDAVTNQTIAVKFLESVTSKNVKEFIEIYIPEDKRSCLISDHDHAYISVVEDLEFDKQQLCNVHFMRIMDRKINDIIMKNDYSEEENQAIKEYGNRIKSIFLSKTKEDFIYRLNRLFKKWDDVPEDLKKYYNKKIVRDMHKLTHHLFNKNIPSSTNLIEGKFSNTQKESEKKRFKTIQGCLSYLKPIIERQNKELKRA